MAPDGKTLYVGAAAPGTGAGEVIPISTASNTAGAPVTVSPDGDITALAVTPDGSAVYAALGFNDELVPGGHRHPDRADAHPGRRAPSPARDGQGRHAVRGEQPRSVLTLPPGQPGVLATTHIEKYCEPPP